MEELKSNICSLIALAVSFILLAIMSIVLLFGALLHDYYCLAGCMALLLLFSMSISSGAIDAIRKYAKDYRNAKNHERLYSSTTP